MIKENYERLLTDLQHYTAHPTTLVAVSKKMSLSLIQEAYEVGQRHFGENRVMELLEKSKTLEEKGLHDIVWHFIGHLQSNKVSKLLQIKGPLYLHSVDSLSLLKQIVTKAKREIFFFLEVHTTDEEQKSGFKSREELEEAIKWIADYPHPLCHFHGLMTMGPIRTDNFEEDTKRSFKMLKDLRDSIDPQLKLSMGMSGDYKWALELESDYVRIGTAFFKA